MNPYLSVWRSELEEKLKAADDLVILGMRKLDNRFAKIDPDKYYLSYSGGEDSEIVRLYIQFRNLPIKIVSLNTYREHKDIVARMKEHADVILYPDKTFEWIYENYGAPCFSKQQDEYIKRYQNGSRSDNTMNAIMGGKGSKFQLNETARKLTITEQLHKVSGECCTWTKKVPLKKYGKESGLLPIVCVRGEESNTRKSKYTSCLKPDGMFTPIFDIPKEIMDAMRAFFEMKSPEIYRYVDRTGCIGCPYGRNIETELAHVTPAQKRYAIKSFEESYKVKGVNYKDTQLSIFDYEGEDT